MTDVRTFSEVDRPALRSIVRAAGEGTPSASLWGHEDSEAAIYLDPYMLHAPDSLFLAFDDGELVGYLTGCLDTAAFPSESDRIDRAITDHKLLTKAGPIRFFFRAAVDSLGAKIRRQPTAGDFDDPRWPAHLHINIIPAARGTGAARALMQAWDARLAEHGSPGCHLQTLTENVRAVRFLEKHGYIPHGPALAVPGLREDGRRLHQQTMVRPAADGSTPTPEAT